MHDGCPRGYTVYTLKLTLLLLQFPTLPWYRKKQLEKMTFFITFVCLRYWFTSPSCTVLQVLALNSTSGADSSPNYTRNWLKLEKQLLQDSFSEAVLKSSTHCPSPTPSFLLRLTLNKLAEKISQLPEDYTPNQNPALPKVLPTSLILDFVRPRSTVLFKTLGIPHSFLASSSWKDQPEYDVVKAAVRNHTPVNDSFERALGLTTTFNGTITKDETSYQDLILVVKAHMKKNKLQKKKDLKILF